MITLGREMHETSTPMQCCYNMIAVTLTSSLCEIAKQVPDIVKSSYLSQDRKMAKRHGSVVSYSL